MDDRVAVPQGRLGQDYRGVTSRSELHRATSEIVVQDAFTFKVYEVEPCRTGKDKYVVNFRYGRRGSNLKDGTKNKPTGADQFCQHDSNMTTPP